MPKWLKLSTQKFQLLKQKVYNIDHRLQCYLLCFIVAGMLRLFTTYTALIPLDGQRVSTYTGSHFSLGQYFV